MDSQENAKTPSDPYTYYVHELAAGLKPASMWRDLIHSLAPSKPENWVASVQPVAVDPIERFVNWCRSR